MAHRIQFKPSATRDLARLPKSVQKKIARKIDSLATNPRSSGIKKITGLENLYRIRSGDYRILYQIRDKTLLILVIRIGHR